VSKLSIFYTLLALAVVGFYGFTTAFGEEPFSSPPRERTTKEARKTGYRGSTFIFIHSSGGFRGK